MARAGSALVCLLVVGALPGLGWGGCPEGGDCRAAPGADESSLLQFSQAGGKVAYQDVPLAGLHCCDTVTNGSSLPLACDTSPEDYIKAIPYAVLIPAAAAGTPAFLYQCGSGAVPDGCGASVRESAVIQSCVGQRACLLDPANFTTTCEGKVQLRVQFQCYCDTADCTAAPPAKLPPMPLSTKGSLIVDAHGKRVRLKAVNWAGAHIVHAPAGLGAAPVRSLVRKIRELGFNSVRLTWSVEGVLTNPVVEDVWVAANPGLVGKPFLEVLDKVVEVLNEEGIMIVLDNHMSDSDWCCDRVDCNGLWFNPRWSEDDWVKAHVTLAKRYAHVPAYIGAGLRNEPRSTCSGKSWGGEGEYCNASLLDPSLEGAEGCAELTWNTGPKKFRWKRAAEKAGHAILKVNPRLLIAVGGLEYATDLRQFGKHPLNLPKGRYIYEAHEYYWGTYSRTGYTTLGDPIKGHPEQLSENDAKSLCSELGGKCAGATCTAGASNCTVRGGPLPEATAAREASFVKEINGGEVADPWPRYRDRLREFWGYILEEDLTPVWVSEFGFSVGFEGWDTEPNWLARWGAYAMEGGPLKHKGGLDWGYWQLSGVQEGGTGRVAGDDESFGVLNRCYTAPAYGPHFAFLQRLMGAPATTTSHWGHKDVAVTA